MAHRVYEDDDGRTVADMSSFEPRTPFGFRIGTGKQTQTGRTEAKSDAGSGISREQRRSYIRGALSAALLIGLAFIVGLGLTIALITWVF